MVHHTIITIMVPQQGLMQYNGAALRLWTYHLPYLPAYYTWCGVNHVVYFDCCLVEKHDLSQIEMPVPCVHEIADATLGVCVSLLDGVCTLRLPGLLRAKQYIRIKYAPIEAENYLIEAKHD